MSCSVVQHLHDLFARPDGAAAVLPDRRVKSTSDVEQDLGGDAGCMIDHANLSALRPEDGNLSVPTFTQDTLLPDRDSSEYCSGDEQTLKEGTTATIAFRCTSATLLAMHTWGSCDCMNGGLVPNGKDKSGIVPFICKVMSSDRRGICALSTNRLALMSSSSKDVATSRYDPSPDTHFMHAFHRHPPSARDPAVERARCSVETGSLRAASASHVPCTTPS